MYETQKSTLSEISTERPPYLTALHVPVPVDGVTLFEFQSVAAFQGGTQRFEVMPGAETPLDQHATNEIWFIGAGDGELYFDGDWHPISAGDSVHFPSQKPHRMRNRGVTPMTIFSVWWKGKHAEV